LQPPGGGGGDNEARLRVLETHVDYIRGHLARIETATNSANEGVSKLQAETGKLSVKVDHLPSKGFTVSVTITALALLSALVVMVGLLAQTTK
jgi:hypothetical protein